MNTFCLLSLLLLLLFVVVVVVVFVVVVVVIVVVFFFFFLLLLLSFDSSTSTLNELYEEQIIVKKIMISSTNWLELFREDYKGIVSRNLFPPELLKSATENYAKLQTGNGFTLLVCLLCNPFRPNVVIL
jgi:hypothetical protein